MSTVSRAAVRAALAPAATGLVVAGLGAAFRAPGVLYADSGELLTAVAVKGIAHPPGFPLYLLLGGWWLGLTRFLDVTAASRLNLFSALATGVTTALIVLAARRLLARVQSPLGVLERDGVAVLCGLLAGLGPTLFDFSLGIEVYALHAVFLAGAIAAAAAAGAEPDPARRARLSVAAGLCCGGGLAVHHATMVVSMGGLAVLLWGREPGRARIRRVGLFAAGLLPGLAAYVVLPWRAARQPLFNWGDPDDLDRFWKHVSAFIYQVNIESSPGVIAEHAGRFLDAYRQELTVVGLLLALLGLVTSARRGTFTGLGLLALVAGDVAFAVRYEIAEDQAAYYIPTFLASALLVGLGVAWLAARAAGRGRWVVAAALLATVVFTGRNATARSRARDGRAIESAESFLASVPEGGLVLTAEWNLYAPVLGLRTLEGARPDALVLDVLLFRRGWYLDSFRIRNPERYAEVKHALDPYRKKLGDWEEDRPYDGNELTRLYDDFVRQLVLEAWARGVQPVWIGTVMQDLLPRGAALVPAGLGYRILPSQAMLSTYVEDTPLSFKAALRSGLPNDYVFEDKIRPLYVGMLAQRAFYEMAFRKLDRAGQLLGVARNLDPKSAAVLEGLGDLRVAEGKREEALALYADAMAAGGDGNRLGTKTRDLLKPAP